MVKRLFQILLLVISFGLVWSSSLMEVFGLIILLQATMTALAASTFMMDTIRSVTDCMCQSPLPSSIITVVKITAYIAKVITQNL